MTPAIQALTSPEIAWWITGLVLVLQLVWALFIIVLSWGFRRILRDIEDNTKATQAVAAGVQGLNILLAGQYATRVDVDRVASRMTEVEKDLAGLKAIATAAAIRRAR